jgi:hypothetical protein
MADRRPRRPRFAAEPPPDGVFRPCETPGCANQGEFRAPKSRRTLNQYYWFCLDHVREYNAAWDFYRGMTPADIEAAVRQDSTWGRPTWPLGSLGAASLEERLADPLGLLHAKRRQAPPPSIDTPAELKPALATLDLVWPVTLDDVRTRWKALVKRHHPDIHGGDPAADERVKAINQAYTFLRNRLRAAA